MSDLIYRQAVTEDGEPVAVTEGLSRVARWITRPCSWALILPGDTVLCRFPMEDEPLPAVVNYAGAKKVSIDVTVDDGRWPTEHVYPADLTLVCGSSEDNPHRFGDNTNPAWRWDR